MPLSQSFSSDYTQEINFDQDNLDLASLELESDVSNAVLKSDENALADVYSNIYVFGDSLVDTGNLFNTTTFVQDQASIELDLPVLPPSPPYFEGRFANGQIWIDNLARELNIDLTSATELTVVSPGSDILSPITLIEENPVVSPFFNGSTTNQSVNFGYGLATTGVSGAGELGSFTPGMEQQVEFFIADHLQADQVADSNALYVLWAGSNDYLNSAVDPVPVVENIETQVDSLYDLGGRNFLVVNLPDLGAIPEANNPERAISPEELSKLSDAHNLLLDSTVDQLEDTLTGAKITVLDVNSLFDDVLANPAEFGLSNVTESFLDPVTFTATVDANPDEYFFFDTLHPTEVAHTILSDFALETLATEVEI